MAVSSKVQAACDTLSSHLERRVLLGGHGPVRVRDILATLEAAGIETLLSGGCVRDALAGEAPVDIDVTALAGAHGLRDLLASVYGESAIAMFIPRIGTIILGGPGGTCLDFGVALDWRSVLGAADIVDVEFAPSHSLENDCLTRDFCCNALYWSPGRGLVDPTGRGIEDCLRRTISICTAPEKARIDPRLSLRIALFIVRGYRPDADSTAYLRDHIDGDVARLGRALPACLDEMTRRSRTVKKKMVEAIGSDFAARDTLRLLQDAVAGTSAASESYLFLER